MTSQTRDFWWACVLNFLERFSFYGVVSILVLSMVDHGLSDWKSYMVYGVFTTLCYLMPMLGGMLSDHKLGEPWTILWGFLLQIISCFLLTFYTGWGVCLWTGLGFMALSVGLIKPSLVSLAGRSFDHAPHEKESAYTIYYVFQNIGALLAPFLCGTLGQVWGWQQGYLTAGVLSVAGFLCCLSRSFSKRSLFHLAYTHTKLLISCAYMVMVLPLLWLIKESLWSRDLLTILCIGVLVCFFTYLMIQKLFSLQTLIVLFAGTLAIAISGALIGHGADAISLFAKRNVYLFLRDFEILPVHFQMINPVVIIILGALMSFMWRFLSKGDVTLNAFTKYILGFLVIAGSFFLLKRVCADHTDGLVSPLWVILSLAISAFSDLLIFPVALSECSRVTPEKWRAQTMGLMVFAMAFSQLIGSYLAQLAALPGPLPPLESLPIYEWFFTNLGWYALGVIPLFVLSLGAVKFITKEKHSQKE